MIHVSLRASEELATTIDRCNDTMRQVADNQAKILTLHEENNRLLSDLAGHIGNAVHKGLKIESI